MQISEFQNVLILIAIAGFALMEFATRRYQTTVSATANDTKLELFMFISLVAITQPLVILATQNMGEAWFSQWQGIWADWPWWAMFGVLLLGDDLTQYLWHRASHSPFLWPLHRALTILRST